MLLSVQLADFKPEFWFFFSCEKAENIRNGAKYRKELRAHVSSGAEV